MDKDMGLNETFALRERKEAKWRCSHGCPLSSSSIGARYEDSVLGTGRM
jgi:hypothetical protein